MKLKKYGEVYPVIVMYETGNPGFILYSKFYKKNLDGFIDPSPIATISYNAHNRGIVMLPSSERHIWVLTDNEDAYASDLIYEMVENGYMTFTGRVFNNGFMDIKEVYLENSFMIEVKKEPVFEIIE